MIDFRQTQDDGGAGGRCQDHQRAVKGGIGREQPARRKTKERKNDQLQRRYKVHRPIKKQQPRLCVGKADAQNKHAKGSGQSAQSVNAPKEQVGQTVAPSQKVERQTDRQPEDRGIENGVPQGNVLFLACQTEHPEGEHQKVHGKGEADGVASHLGTFGKESAHDGDAEEAHVSAGGAHGDHAVGGIFGAPRKKEDQKEKHSLNDKGQKEELRHFGKPRAAVGQGKKGRDHHEGRADIQKDARERGQMLGLGFADFGGDVAGDHIEKCQQHHRKCGFEVQKIHLRIDWTALF